ncbi:hypothetical protein A1O3_03807 [Capronia epimyces CBS 606.96]|uniref:Ribonuclease H2 subunit B n=1 Tax=Capronia epimyces CBS 606.96 TaxID=1182542 RepID=W9Y302_9EURO|nr:uncharacterized protein A1O3_03807 [Capronia epimyces CBS 606.96]EXJ86853.1 hypothetical protein A1O3_03807 [Capronia epimyces CBS 606.96]
MAVGTRSSTTSPVKKHAKETCATKSESKSNAQREPLRPFILPRDTCDRSRFLLLRHPRDCTLQRFLFCPETGLFQFTKVQTPSTDPRSLLFARADPDGEKDSPETLGKDSETEQALSRGYISKSAEIFVATPFDLAFILLPLVLPAKAPSGKMLFQPIDDILEQHIQEDKHLRYIYDHGRTMLEDAMSRFCDTIEAGDEQMYRPSEDKALRMVMQKVDNAMRGGLPASLEEKFVTRALEAPVLSVKREETSISTISTNSAQATSDDNESQSEGLDSQSTSASSAPSMVFSDVSTASSASTVVPDTSIPQELCDLQKRRTVVDFILASYLPASLADRLRGRLGEKDSPVDFSPLEKHLQSLAAMRAEVLASRSIGDFSRKRGLEDDEVAESRAEKKRRQEEEDKKKKLGESRGVRDLKKVNVSGMKKMSDFFAKKPVAKAKG